MECWGRVWVGQVIDTKVSVRGSFVRHATLLPPNILLDPRPRAHDLLYSDSLC